MSVCSGNLRERLGSPEACMADLARHPTALPAHDDLLWPTLKAIGGSASNDELLAKVIELESIPEHVAGFIHTDNRQTKLAYNLAGAKTYLKPVGAIENSSRGV